MPSGKQWANITHWQYSGGASTPGTTEITALDNLLTRLWTGTAFGAGVAWLPNCNSSLTLIDSTYYPLNPLGLSLVFSHAATGGLATVSLPSEVAHVLTLRTAKRGRSYRGRIYLPAVTTAGVAAGGVLGATIITATLAQWAGLVTAAAAVLWVPVVASYLHSTAEPVLAATMDNKMDVQRHRK